MVHNPYYLIDLVGRLVQTGSINHENTILDITKLTRGIYLIQIGNLKNQNSRLVIK